MAGDQPRDRIRADGLANRAACARADRSRPRALRNSSARAPSSSSACQTLNWKFVPTGASVMRPLRLTKTWRAMRCDRASSRAIVARGHRFRELEEAAASLPSTNASRTSPRGDNAAWMRPNGESANPWRMRCPRRRPCIRRASRRRTARRGRAAGRRRRVPPPRPRSAPTRARRVPASRPRARASAGSASATARPSAGIRARNGTR